MMVRIFVAAASLLISNIGLAGAWVFDDAHSSADFSIRHMMVSNVKGQIGGLKGTIDIDDKDLTKSKVDVSLDVTTIDTRNGKRDEHLKSPDFFDVQKFPQMHFVGKKIEKSGKGLKVTGDLTMKGVTKPTVLMVDGPTSPVKDPWGKMKRGFTAQATINRKEFGLTWNKALDGGGVVLGDDVKVTIEAELEEKK
jgi:polyisoprenoid-binding protein YceI